MTERLQNILEDIQSGKLKSLYNIDLSEPFSKWRGYTIIWRYCNGNKRGLFTFFF